MNRITQLAAVIVLLLTLNFQLCHGFAQGSLTPPGPPGPTMVTLQQIEPRTPISSAPYTITNPGSYYLTGNLVVSSGDAIDILVSSITLDLNGFTIYSGPPNGSGAGIAISGGQNNIRILNGNITGYFLTGILGSGVFNVRVTDVAVFGVGGDGINLGTTNATVIERCTVNQVGGIGIEADIVGNSAAYACGDTGIVAGTAHNCHGEGEDNAGVYVLYTAENCTGVSSASLGLSAGIAQSCVGNSSGTDGTGLLAGTAQNCIGYASGSTDGLGLPATGLHAAETALNCYGYATGSGTGLYVYYVAQNCTGLSGYGGSTEVDTGTGDGLDAQIAHNCYGWAQSSGGTALRAGEAENCFGWNVYGAALNAWYANFCFGSNFPGEVGPPVIVSYYYYNMPAP